MSHDEKEEGRGTRRTLSDNEITREKYRLSSNENEMPNLIQKRFKSDGNLLTNQNMSFKEEDDINNGRFSQLDEFNELNGIYGSSGDYIGCEMSPSDFLYNCDSVERCSCISIDNRFMTSQSTMLNTPEHESNMWVNSPPSKKHSLASNYSHLNGGHHTLHLIDLQTNRRICCHDDDDDDDQQCARPTEEKLVKCTPAGSENSWPSIPWQDLERETVL